MFLAADVGGTKTLMGLYRPHAERPQAQVVREYATLDFDSLDDIVGAFLDETGAGDIEAVAYAVPVLEPDEIAVLQEGIAVPTGNAALIAAGTGLGEALLHNVNGRFLPSASEGGHADFAARTPRELAFVEELSKIYGRVDNERVISGPGLVNL